ncbi:hypothetical protein SAMN05421767_12114 [Granulicatella balaenopterae]|uniref:Uncharacterized protein n=1 Tax=Granulicatella balaenopterae TaxID=137733 RepID=A0A1H9LSC3_9LACT|nr:hypothetical protein [Granulicatella balaenopterae]SER14095.1 hypothetical protein SAMN05421767_12114 [Granulicatella balaenopterae]
MKKIKKMITGFRERLIHKYTKSTKRSVFVYAVLRVMVIIVAIRQLIHGNFEGTFLCAFTLLLFTIPTYLEDSFQITFPSALESIIYIFIFASEILGSIGNFYGLIPFWDTMLHTTNGFICAGIGFSLVYILNDKSAKVTLSPFYVAFVGFCVSMTVGVCWEFYEYAGDRYFAMDMQKDRIVEQVNSVYLNPENTNEAFHIDGIHRVEIFYGEDDVYVIDGGYLDPGINDTMKDLFVNLIGAVTFSTLGYFYLYSKQKYAFLSNFIPVKNEDVEIKTTIE